MSHNDEKQKILEKCHISDILEGIVPNDSEEKSIGDLWVEEGTYRKWLRRKIVD